MNFANIENRRDQPSSSRDEFLLGKCQAIQAFRSMKKRIWLIGSICLLPLTAVLWYGAGSTTLPNRRLDRLTRALLSEPAGAQRPQMAIHQQAAVLDTREAVEYAMSHLPGAIRIGYQEPELSIVSEWPKDTNILVYCSIGYRSEHIQDSLRKRGFTDVKNLLGGIFAWAEAGLPLENAAGAPTDSIHGFSAFWAWWTDYDKVRY